MGFLAIPAAGDLPHRLLQVETVTTIEIGPPEPGSTARFDVVATFVGGQRVVLYHSPDEEDALKFLGWVALRVDASSLG